MITEWRTTSIILDRLAAGDDDAWRVFLSRFRAPIVKIARERGLDNAEADDAAQQTLFVFYDGMKNGRFDRDKGRLSAWLFGIARLTIQRSIEKKIARKDRGLGGSGDPFPSAIEESREKEAWENAWRESILAAALARVREEVEEKTWAVFERVQLKNESPEKVADELGMTRNAVFIAKHRVLTRLRRIEKDLDDGS